MKFRLRKGLIWLSFELEYDGSRYTIHNCILDTGSATTAIDIDSVDFNFQKPAVITRLIGIGGGTQEVITQKADKLIIGGHELKCVEVEFGNLQADMGINGFLGNDILSLFTITIDYSRQKIKFKI